MKYKRGEVVKGKIIKVMPYGAFVQIDGDMTGLLHISEVSNDYVKDINAILHENEMINLKIVDIDYDKKQLIFSRKALLTSGRKIARKSKTRYNQKVVETPKGFTELKKWLPVWIKEFTKEK